MPELKSNPSKLMEGATMASSMALNGTGFQKAVDWVAKLMKLDANELYPMALETVLKMDGDTIYGDDGYVCVNDALDLLETAYEGVFEGKPIDLPNGVTGIKADVAVKVIKDYIRREATL